jgi:hypothetical protein
MTVAKKKAEVVEEANSPSPAEIDGDSPPGINSVGWTPWVLGKLLPDELFDGLPTAEGLLRLVHEYLGVVVESRSVVNQSPCLANGCHACVTHDITVEHFYSPSLGGLAGKRAGYAGVADVFAGNGSKDAFSFRYASATCETRAKSRAYRSALRLRHVVAKEECGEGTNAESGAAGLVALSQLAAIDLMCSRTDVNAEAMLRACWKHLDKQLDPAAPLSKVPFATAARALAQLQPWQQAPDSVPGAVRGYVRGWRGVG